MLSSTAIFSRLYRSLSHSTLLLRVGCRNLHPPSFLFGHKERRAALLKEREEARARGEVLGGLDLARSKAKKKTEAAAAAGAGGVGGIRFSIDEDETAQVGVW